MIPSRCKTPLRYPGGKSRATQKMFEYLPNMANIKQYHEGFLGGGSVALAFSKQYPNIPVWVNDLYVPLFNFWCILKSHGDQLADLLTEYKLSAPTEEGRKELFLLSKEVLNDFKESELELAARFFIVNKCSFSGLTQSSSFSKSASVNNFNLNGIENLRLYPRLMKNWRITNGCYSKLLSDDPNTFVYLDPPYDIKDSLYGNKGNMHKGFNHEEFATNCNAHSAPTMISYNNDNWVKERFSEWHDYTFPLTYTLRSTGNYSEDQAKRLELLMCNYEVLQQKTVLDFLVMS